VIRVLFADTGPLLPTAGKGRVTFETAVAHMLELIDEYRARPVEERRDFQIGPVQLQIRW
jgi:hypothetical protein